MDSALAQPDRNPGTPKVSHREQRRALIADVCGHAYAAVIERAAELHYRLVYAALGHTPAGHPNETTLVSVAHNQARHEAALVDRRNTAGARALIADRYRDAVTLAALREAATLILQAPPLNKNEPVASNLAALHIWRMVRAMEQDDHTVN